MSGVCNDKYFIVYVHDLVVLFVHQDAEHWPQPMNNSCAAHGCPWLQTSLLDHGFMD